VIYVVATLMIKPETHAEFIAAANALVPHRTAEHMKTFGRVVVKCLASPPKIEVITPEKVDVR